MLEDRVLYGSDFGLDPETSVELTRGPGGFSVTSIAEEEPGIVCSQHGDHSILLLWAWNGISKASPSPVLEVSYRGPGKVFW